MDIHFVQVKEKLPEGITLDVREGAVTVIQRWWSLWNAILAGIATVVCFVPYLKGDVEMMWLGQLGLAAAIFFIVASWLQRTVLEVSRSQLTLRHGPIPWFGSHDVDAAKIDQLMTHRSLRFDRQGFETASVYELKAVLMDGSKVHLLGGMRVEATVRTIEMQIERLLGIANRIADGRESTIQRILRFAPAVCLLVIWAWIFFKYIYNA